MATSLRLTMEVAGGMAKVVSVLCHCNATNLDGRQGKTQTPTACESNSDHQPIRTLKKKTTCRPGLLPYLTSLSSDCLVPQ
jgi:hypothetical protein